MSTVTCPNGHQSVSTDYCDTCGAPIGDAGADSGAAATPAAGATTTLPAGPSPDAVPQTCPNCGTENRPSALFCEGCGYDFTTGALPRGAAPDAGLAGAGSAGAGSSGAGPTGGGASGGSGQPAPAVGTGATPAPLAPAVPLEWVVEVWVDPEWYAQQESTEPCPSPGLPVIVPLTVRSVLVGRTSRSRNIHPEIACEADIAVSRRHAQLSTDGTRWWVEDLGSSNGTFVGPASGPLPTDPLVPGQRRELVEDDRVYVGAWTRLVVRRATEEEQAGGV